MFPEAMEEDRQPPSPSPRLDIEIEMVIANLVNVAVVRPPSPYNMPPPSIHPNLSSIISTKEGEVL